MVITQLCSGSKAYDFFRVEQGNPLLKSLSQISNIENLDFCQRFQFWIYLNLSLSWLLKSSLITLGKTIVWHVIRHKVQTPYALENAQLVALHAQHAALHEKQANHAPHVSHA